MKESKFSKNYNDAMLVKWPHMWYMKIHGHEMQASSIPDYLYSINGIFVAIEFKIQRDNIIQIKKLQVRELAKIKNSKSIALIVAHDENTGKILIRERRIDWKTMKNNYIKNLDWDFEFSHYESAIDIMEVMINGI